MKSLFPSLANVQNELNAEDGTDVRSFVSKKRYFNFPEVDNISYGPALFAKEMEEHADVAVYPNDPRAPLPNTGYDIVTGLEHSSDSRAYNPPMRDRAGFNGYNGTPPEGEIPIDSKMVEDVDSNGVIRKQNLDIINMTGAETYSFEDQTNQFSKRKKQRKVQQDPMHMDETTLDDGRNMAVNYSPSFYDHSEYGTFVKDTPRLQIEQTGTPIEDIESGTTSKVEQFNQLPLFDNIGFMQNRFTQSMNNALAERDRLSQVGTNSKRPMGNSRQVSGLDETQGVDYSLIRQTNQNSINQHQYRKPSASALDMSETELDDGRNMAVNYAPNFYNHSEYGTYVNDSLKLQIEEVGTPISQIEQQTRNKVEQFEQLPLFNNRGFMNNRFTQAMNTFLSEEDRLSQVGTNFHRPMGISPNFAASTSNKYTYDATKEADTTTENTNKTPTTPASVAMPVFSSVGEIFLVYKVIPRDFIAQLQNAKIKYTALLNEFQPASTTASKNQKSQSVALQYSNATPPTYSLNKTGLKGVETKATKDKVIGCIKSVLTTIEADLRMVDVIIKPLMSGQFSGDYRLFNNDGTIYNESASLFGSTKANAIAKLAITLKTVQDLSNGLNKQILDCDALIDEYKNPTPSSKDKTSARGRGTQSTSYAPSTQQRASAIKSKRIGKDVEMTPVADKRSSTQSSSTARTSLVDTPKASSQSAQTQDSRKGLQVKGEVLIKAYGDLLRLAEKIGKPFDAISQKNWSSIVGLKASTINEEQKGMLSSFVGRKQPALTAAIKLLTTTKSRIPSKSASNALVSVSVDLLSEFESNRKTLNEIYNTLSAMIVDILRTTPAPSGGSKTQQGGGSTTQQGGGSTTQQGGGSTTQQDGGGSTTQQGGGGSTTQQGGGGSTTQQGGGGPQDILPFPEAIIPKREYPYEIIKQDRVGDFITLSLQGRNLVDIEPIHPYLTALTTYLLADVDSGALTSDVAAQVIQAQFIPANPSVQGYPSHNMSSMGSKPDVEYNFVPNPRYAEIAQQGSDLSKEDYAQVRDDVINQLSQTTPIVTEEIVEESYVPSQIQIPEGSVVMQNVSPMSEEGKSNTMYWLLGGIVLSGAAYFGYKQYQKKKSQ